MKFLFYIILVATLSSGCSAAVVQEKYRNHTVEKGETVYSISKKYNVSEKAIYRLNPDAKKGVNEGALIILPKEDIINSGGDTQKFKTHKVKRKEGLYAISKKYKVSQDVIKKYNKQLYARNPRKGEKLRIPVFASGNGDIAVNNTETNMNNTSISSETAEATHTVKKKETIYGIARMYGITVNELTKMNPSVPENLPIGIVLKVPSNQVTTDAVIDNDRYDFYEVQPAEGFYRLKVKLGMTEDEIVALNPYAKEGLKEGMVLKIPKKVSESIETATIKRDLESLISNRAAKRIAVMLPFQLDKATVDDEGNQDFIKRNKSLRVALDFYSGVLMATEFAKDKGLNITLDVYDTGGSSGGVSSVISRNNFSNTDAVIGPLLRKNVEAAASALKRENVPVFSPLSNREIKMQSNLFQTLPTDAMLRERMIAFIENNAKEKNLIVIADVDKKTEKAQLSTAFPTAKAIELRKDAFLYLQDIDDKIDKTKDNWIILESDNPVLVSNVVALLNGMPANYGLRLVTLDKNDAYEYNDVSNLHLAKLDFTYPSVNKTYNFNEKDAFLTSYKNEYGVLPNRYAVRGFDVTYDVLLRLASANDVYESVDSDYVTEYIENKFQYSKKFLSGYQNNAVYIVKYNKDLQFEEVK